MWAIRCKVIANGNQTYGLDLVCWAPADSAVKTIGRATHDGDQ